MNRKQRKARLKRLNKKRKENAKQAITKGFMDKVSWSTWKGLEKLREELEYEFAWVGDTEKVRVRLTYVEMEMNGRAKSRNYWNANADMYPPK